MDKRLLFCWLGATDLRAASGQADVGLGPVAQAAKVSLYQEIVLLNNWDRVEAGNYVNWLKSQTSSLVSLVNIDRYQ